MRDNLLIIIIMKRINKIQEVKFHSNNLLSIMS